MAKPLMEIATFANSLKACAEALKPLNFDLMKVLLSEDKEELKKNVTNPFVAITAMQIALYDVLCLLDLQFEGIIGHSFGEVGCAYADGCLTREQAILTAYWRGKIVETAKLPRGMLSLHKVLRSESNLILFTQVCWLRSASRGRRLSNDVPMALWPPVIMGRIR